MKALVFLVLGLVLGIVFWGMSNDVSRKADLQDGGDAQVIRVELPPLSNDAQSDLLRAQYYETIAHGNLFNARGDAETTVANATARQMDAGSMQSWLVIGGMIGIGMLIAVSLKKSE